MTPTNRNNTEQRIPTTHPIAKTRSQPLPFRLGPNVASSVYHKSTDRHYLLNTAIAVNQLAVYPAALVGTQETY
jgi:hypothetical protein